MNVVYSKIFEKSARKLSGKYLASLAKAISEVKHAEDLSDITNCKKLTGFNNVYRIRVGDYRAFCSFAQGCKNHADAESHEAITLHHAEEVLLTFTVGFGEQSTECFVQLVPLLSGELHGGWAFAEKLCSLCHFIPDAVHLKIGFKK